MSIILMVARPPLEAAQGMTLSRDSITPRYAEFLWTADGTIDFGML
jgi:hypothetical protein